MTEAVQQSPFAADERSALRAVAEDTLSFEGRIVDGTATKISGLTALDETNGLVLHTDDRVRMVVESRVTGVNHAVDKDGQLIRTHLLKVLSADLAPWDPSDLDDSGVLRA